MRTEFPVSNRSYFRHNPRPIVHVIFRTRVGRLVIDADVGNDQVFAPGAHEFISWVKKIDSLKATGP